MEKYKRLGELNSWLVNWFTGLLVKRIIGIHLKLGNWRSAGWWGDWEIRDHEIRKLIETF